MLPKTLTIPTANTILRHSIIAKTKRNYALMA
jgi:hypothetical protein